jgi:hypothetical protein
MNEPESLSLTFGEGSRQEGPATCVGRRLYRLGWTPLFATVEDEDVEMHWGDVIEVEPTADGRNRFVRVVERGPFDHSDYVVGPAFLQSTYFDVFATALETVGGSWEVPINGLLLTHVPTGGSFDVGEQLLRERIRAFQAGVRDAPPNSD